MAKRRRPVAISDPGPDAPANGDLMSGLDVQGVLDGRNRPGLADPEGDRQWLQARRHALRIADERFDPRAFLTNAQPEQWREARLLYVAHRVQQ